MPNHFFFNYLKLTMRKIMRILRTYSITHNILHLHTPTTETLVVDHNKKLHELAGVRVTEMS